MSGTGGMDLEGLGNDALRVAHSLFAPAALPARLPGLNGLLTDPAECLNALLAPLTPLTQGVAAPPPQPPESAAASGRDAQFAEQWARQADSGAETAMHTMPGVTGWSDAQIETLTDARTVLRSASNAFTSSAAPAAFPVRNVEPQDTNGTAHREDRAFPDALDTLRSLTTTARNSITLPSVGVNSAPHKSETRVTSKPAALPFPAGRDENEDRRDTRKPFLGTPPLDSGGPFSIRQGNTKPHETGQSSRQAAPPASSRQSGEEAAPLRLMQGASSLAAMLQTHVRPVPTDATPLPASTDVPNWPAAQADTPPGPLRPAPLASRTKPTVQESALTPPDAPNAPNNIAPPVSAPPDVDALIQALESHLELEFLRSYGTSGR